MRSLLLTAAVTFPAFACDSGAPAEAGAPAKAKAAANAAPVAPTASPGKTTAADAPAPALAPTDGRPPAGTELHPGDRGFDCGQLLTGNEVAAICGEPVGSVVIDSVEGRSNKTACSRRWRHEDKRTVSLIIATHEKVEEAVGLSTPPDAVAVSGIGDAAHSFAENKADVVMWEILRARLGGDMIYLKSITVTGGSAICDPGELATLAGEVAGRMVQVVP